MESFSHDFPDLENIVQLPDLLDDYSDNNSLSELAQSSASATDQSLSRKSEEYVKPKTTSKENDKGKKSKINPNGTKKVKVNWTPELHQRFVEAVEMLGIDNAVPSKILELMGVDYLTRHNIASHLQKYRSHQKYLRVREAELACLTQRRQMHIPTSTAFPPHFTTPVVWGHPWLNQPLMHAPVASSLTGTPYFPTPVAPTSSPNGLPAQGIPSPPCDIHPSKESVDAAVREVLAKPWLPPPLGLKPPSFERKLTTYVIRPEVAHCMVTSIWMWDRLIAVEILLDMWPSNLLDNLQIRA